MSEVVKKLMANQFAVKKGAIRIKKFSTGSAKFSKIDNEKAKLKITLIAEVAIDQNNGGVGEVNIKDEVGSCGVFTYGQEMIENALSNIAFDIAHTTNNLVLLRAEADTNARKGKQGNS